MKQKQLNNAIKTLKACLLFIVILFLLVWGIWAYNYVFEPSYASVVGACDIESSVSKRYVTAGTFGFGFKNESMNGIKVVMPKDYSNEFNNNYLRNRYMETKEYNMIVKHEKCHENQYLNNRLFGCQNPVMLYFNEVECYIKQYL